MSVCKRQKLHPTMKTKKYQMFPSLPGILNVEEETGRHRKLEIIHGGGISMGSVTAMQPWGTTLDMLSASQSCWNPAHDLSQGLYLSCQICELHNRIVMYIFLFSSV